ncbi:hypothetical protein AVEN_116007-1 [Araneus ventricosus]|uniref:Phosphatidic acid phosphatase type 2/haloperoxidase domain-containing protein n=1 Tax=Araneus ventricosus TaxID=182803 RepID=A0A4Y2ELP4_ARAVE|nr:hypothetical protein AVEN_116007-1 [Araneus ventricosus]
MYIYSKKNDAVNGSLKMWWSRLIPPLCFVWAVICCVSRILDNRHFWWDVLTGICIGTVGGFATARLVLMKTACKSKS